MIRTPDLSIIIPVFNNASSLDQLVLRIQIACEKPRADYEVVLVDDGSHDSSWTKIQDLAAHNDKLVGLRLSRNFGQHSAIAAGFEHARGSMIVLMDADLEDRPENIPALLDELATGSDIVFTTFENQNGKIRNRLSSRIFHFMTSTLSRTYVPTAVGTMRAFNRKVLNAVLQYSESNIVYGPLISTLGFKRSFLSVDRDTNFAGSSYTFRKRLRIAVQALIGFSDYPLILFSIVGMAITAFSLLYALLVVAQYFLFGAQLPTGQTLLLLIVSLTAGFIIFEVGVVGIYVFNIYREVLKRPRYLIMETTSTTS